MTTFHESTLSASGSTAMFSSGLFCSSPSSCCQLASRHRRTLWARLTAAEDMMLVARWKE